MKMNIKLLRKEMKQKKRVKLENEKKLQKSQ